MSNGSRPSPVIIAAIIVICLTLAYLIVHVVAAVDRGDIPCDRPYTPGHCGYEGP